MKGTVGQGRAEWYGRRRLPSRLVAAAMIGVATLFTSKPERDMHWSIPPNFVVLDLRAVHAGQGDPPDVP